MSAGGEHHIVSSPGMGELFAFLNLAVIGAIVWFAGRKGIALSLKARSEEISKTLKDAKVELERTEAALAKSKNELASLAQIQQKMISDAKSQADELSRKIIEESKIAAERLLRDSKLAAAAEFSGAESKLRQILVESAVEETKNIFLNGKDSLARQAHDRLVDRFVNTELGERA